MELSPVQAVHLSEVMRMTAGDPKVTVGLLDGAVAAHADLHGSNITRLDPTSLSSRAALAHGTFVAGILMAARGSLAPSICPDSTLLHYSLFRDDESKERLRPTVTPEDVAAGIVACVDAGARIVNLSVGTIQPSTRLEPELERVLGYAAIRRCIVVAAAGNQGTLGSAAVTRHNWVIPVAAFTLSGSPMSSTNLGASVGRRGLGAPGEGVTSLAPEGGYSVGGGSSAAAAFVTGTVALLWSLFPAATALEIKAALTHAGHRDRRSVTPPLLNAFASYTLLSTLFEG